MTRKYLTPKKDLQKNRSIFRVFKPNWTKVQKTRKTRKIEYSVKITRNKMR